MTIFLFSEQLNNKNEKIFNNYIKESQTYENKDYCYASHMAVIEKFVDSNENNCLIFEDDLKIPDIDEDSLQQITKYIPDDYDIAYFGFCWEKCDHNNKVNYYWSEANIPMCLHAYSVSKKGAQNLIKYMKFEEELEIL